MDDHALTAELAVSRATLSRRFLAVAGENPAGYLTRWRMDLASRRLRDRALASLVASRAGWGEYIVYHVYRQTRELSRLVIASHRESALDIHHGG